MRLKLRGEQGAREGSIPDTKIMQKFFCLFMTRHYTV